MDNYEAIKQAMKRGVDITKTFSKTQIEDAFAKASNIYNMAYIYTSTAPDWCLKLKKVRQEVVEGEVQYGGGLSNVGKESR